MPWVASGKHSETKAWPLAHWGHKSCRGPPIPKCWRKTSKLGTGPKITVTSQTTSTSDIFWLVLTCFDMFWHVLFLESMQNPQVIGCSSTGDDDCPVPRTESIFILPSDINSSYSHRADLGHTLRLQFSLATPVVGNMFGECGLRFGAWWTVMTSWISSCISVGKCSLCLSPSDQLEFVGIVSVHPSVVDVPLLLYRKDPKRVADIPRWPDVGWIDDRHVSTHDFMGQSWCFNSECPFLAMRCVILAWSETWTLNLMIEKMWSKTDEDTKWP